ncbi:MAG: CBS domain-containing protein [Chloroflexi bacterium]|nr:CBS domain-containing protein [Chloroflexota bacterium]MCI0646951.1 CBS domain-containing protein [Chloroflexota bacterium]MCI0730015.1 CBS domain-containing protein [Chloroflexota bacterium]
MNVSQVMKRNVISISSSATVGQAAARFASQKIGMLPVVDPAGRLVGVLNLRDLIDLVMPVFVQLIDDFDFVGDFGVLEEQQPSPELMAQPVTAVMEPPITVKSSSGLVRAFAIMHKHQLLDMPIVNDQDQLVGLVSRVDIGSALLASWRTNTAGDKPT